MTQQERLENIFNNLVEELDLDYGNAGFECMEDDGRFVGLIEAPNNTTLQIDIDFDLEEELTDEEIEDIFKKEMKKTIYDFDPEETFEIIWHPNFEFGAFQFVEMLQGDEKFFNEVDL